MREENIVVAKQLLDKKTFLEDILSQLKNCNYISINGTTAFTRETDKNSDIAKELKESVCAKIEDMIAEQKQKIINLD